jgi:hypothetical protein
MYNYEGFILVNVHIRLCRSNGPSMFLENMRSNGCVFDLQIWKSNVHGIRLVKV